MLNPLSVNFGDFFYKLQANTFIAIRKLNKFFSL